MSIRPSAALLALALVLAACSSQPSPSVEPSVSADASASSVPSPSVSAGLRTIPDDALYYPAADAVAAAAQGQIIASQQLAAPAGMLAWFVVYGSVGEDGNAAAVSGIILAPEAAPPPDGGYPIVAWAHGTTGVADRCAPSKGGIGNIPPEVRDLVAQGYVVTATDYEGLGTDGIHPYLVGISEGRSVLDSIRAAQALGDAKAGAKAVVIGHSQGGQAALWSAQLAPNYAPDLTLLGAFAASPPTDLIAWDTWAISEANVGNLAPSAAPLLLFGVWNSVYDAPLTFLTDEGQRSALAGRVACSPPAVAVTPYLRDPAVGSEWRNLLIANSLGATITGVPMTVVSPRGDQAVQYESQVAGVEAMCQEGDIVELRSVDGDHDASIWSATAWADVESWISDRFADAQSVTTCANPPAR